MIEAIVELNPDRLPIDGTHIETKHYSSFLIDCGTAGICCEIISKNRNDSLNHTVVKNVQSGTDVLELSRIFQSYMLLELENMVRGGNTARQSLILFTKPSEKDKLIAKRAFDGFMRESRRYNTL